MRKASGFLEIAALCLCLCFCAQAQEISVEILSPTPEEGVEAGNTLFLEARGEHVDYLEVSLSWDDGEYTLPIRYEGSSVSQVLTLEPDSRRITVHVAGVRELEEGGTQSAEASVTLKTPRETLMDSMIHQAWRDSENDSKNFLRAHESADAGMCKNFVMRMFETFRDEYFMMEYPDVEMQMPLNQSVEGCLPYKYCVEWRELSPQEGNCFEEVGRFRYDESLSEEENRRAAQELFEEVKRGDCLQMAGVCNDFNSAHTLIFIADYDPETEEFHWTDCNMKGTRIDGERYGYVLYDTQKDMDWFLDTVSRKQRGATLYRLREDIARK